MGIEVRHDINPGLIPFNIGYAQFLQRLQGQGQGQQGNLQASAAQSNARIQGDGDALARKNALRAAGKLPPDPSTGAGFNWNGVQNGGDVLGQMTATPDPITQDGQLAGSEESQGAQDMARDYQNYDYRSAQQGPTLLSSGGGAGMSLAERNNLGANAALNGTSTSLQRSKDLADFKDTIEGQRQQANQERARGEEIDRQYAKDMDAYRAGQDQLTELAPGAQDALDQGANGNPDTPTWDTGEQESKDVSGVGSEYSPWQERKRQVHLDVIAKAMADDSVSPQARAKAIKNAQDALEKIKPLPGTKKPAHQFQYTTNDDGSETEIDTLTGKKHTTQPKAAKDPISSGEYDKAMKDAEDHLNARPDAATNPPTDDEIVAEAQKRLSRLRLLKGVTEKQKPRGPFAPGRNATNPAEFDRQADEQSVDTPPAMPAQMPAQQAAPQAAPMPTAPAQALSQIRTESLHPQMTQQIADRFAQLKSQGVPLDEAKRVVAMEIGVGAR